jgi:hypothetical protein
MDNPINEDKKTMPLTSKLVKVQSDLDAGLDKGRRFAELFRTLTTTHDNVELLDAAKQLYAFVVDSDAVVFPKKFEASDYYLIFMTRLIELSGLKTKLGLEIEQKDNYQSLFHSWAGTSQSFRFEMLDGKVEYVDQTSHQTIFSLNLDARKMSFDTDTINNFYFLNNQDDKASLYDEIKLFTKFGQILEDLYGFRVDFNMFDARNQKVYEFEQVGLKPAITDELFVSAAQNHFTLLNAEKELGAFLRLNDHVIFTIFQENPETDQWAIQVNDADEEVSLFDIFKKYDFLNEWYVKNITDLKLKMLF